MELNKGNMKKIILLIIFAVCLFTAFQNLEMSWTVVRFVIGLFVPLILGFCMAFVLNVPMKLFEEKLLGQVKKDSRIWKKMQRPLSVILTLVFIFALIFVLLFLIMPELVNTFRIISESFPGYVESISGKIEGLLAKWNISPEIWSQLNLDWESILSTVKDFLSNGGAFLVNSTMDLTSSVIKTIANIFLGLVFSIYILLNKEKLALQFKKILYAYLPKKRVERIHEVTVLSNQMFTSFITGQVTEAVIIGCLCFLGMKLLAVPYALTISVLVGFTALIPVFGAFIGTAVGVLLILMVEPIKALWFVIFILVLQQLEGNLIYPKVVGKSVGLPGIWVMLAVLVGGSLWGALGMLIGVPICSILYCLLREDVKERLEVKGVTLEDVTHQEVQDVQDD